MAIADDTVGDAPAHRRATRSIRDLPAAERPRERLALRGPGGLSAAELIALVLGTGGGGHSAIELAETLVRRHDSLRALARAIGRGARRRRRGSGRRRRPGSRPRSSSVAARWRTGRPAAGRSGRPRDVARPLVADMGRLEREELRVLSLNTKNVVQRATTVYVGNVSASLVRIGELFRDAVRLDAAGDRARAQPPERRPDAVPGRPPPHGRGDRGRAGCSTWTCSTTS